MHTLLRIFYPQTATHRIYILLSILYGPRWFGQSSFACFISRGHEHFLTSILAKLLVIYIVERARLARSTFICTVDRSTVASPLHCRMFVTIAILASSSCACTSLAWTTHTSLCGFIPLYHRTHTAPANYLLFFSSHVPYRSHYFVFTPASFPFVTTSHIHISLALPLFPNFFFCFIWRWTGEQHVLTLASSYS